VAATWPPFRIEAYVEHITFNGSITHVRQLIAAARFPASMGNPAAVTEYVLGQLDERLTGTYQVTVAGQFIANAACTVYAAHVSVAVNKVS